MGLIVIKSGIFQEKLQNFRAKNILKQNKKYSKAKGTGKFLSSMYIEIQPGDNLHPKISIQ